MDNFDAIGNYDMVKLLGAGHFGVVYSAINLGTKGKVALKVVQSSSDEIAEQVLAEARNIKKSANKHTVQINNAINIEINDVFYSLIDMPLIEGGTLEDLYNTDQLAIRDVLKAIRHVLIGLSGVNSSGIVHRDVKPANILVDGGNFVLGDFGLALEANTSITNHLAYTTHHPPELNQHHCLFDNSYGIDPTYDTYAVGMTFFRLLVPKAIYPIPWGAFSSWAANPKGKTLPNFIGYPQYLPNRVKRIIEKATSLDKSKRYATAKEMIREVDKLSCAINWSIPPNGPVWDSVTEIDSKYHKAWVAPFKGEAMFQYKVDGRKPRGFTPVVGDQQKCAKALCNLVKKSMLK